MRPPFQRKLKTQKSEDFHVFALDIFILSAESFVNLFIALPFSAIYAVISAETTYYASKSAIYLWKRLW